MPFDYIDELLFDQYIDDVPFNHIDVPVDHIEEMPFDYIDDVPFHHSDDMPLDQYVH